MRSTLLRSSAPRSGGEPRGLAILAALVCASGCFYDVPGAEAGSAADAGARDAAAFANDADGTALGDADATALGDADAAPLEDADGAALPRSKAPCQIWTSNGAPSEATYKGQCVGSLAVWEDKDTCYVRDCAAEGESCMYDKLQDVYRCTGSRSSSAALDCGHARDQVGMCVSNSQVLVYERNGKCVVTHCSLYRGHTSRCEWMSSISEFDCT